MVSDNNTALFRLRVVSLARSVGSQKPDFVTVTEGLAQERKESWVAYWTHMSRQHVWVDHPP